ncbi:MAG: hypothetical protein IKU52_05740 [Clostridia bacterium]|nr:hypothetical protein [Clostridia bacterium]
MKKVLSGMLALIICMSLFVGCTKDIKQQPIETNEISDTEEIVDTEEGEADITPTSDGKDDIAASLMGVRQSMIGTPAMVAVAYLGTADSSETADTLNWVKKILPEFTGNLPFIAEIDESHIIGDRHLSLYLIVPCDVNASVAVNRVDENGEVAEVLYRSDYGDPILVYASNSVDTLDTEINIVDSDGNELSYAPKLNDMSYLTQYSDLSVYDLTPYAEILSREYAELQSYSWNLPLEADVVDTSWSSGWLVRNGELSKYDISFSENTAYIQHNEDSLEAPYKLITEEGVCMLRLYPDTDDQRSFCMLISDENDSVYLSQDFKNSSIHCDELLSVLMTRTYG